MAGGEITGFTAHADEAASQEREDIAAHAWTIIKAYAQVAQGAYILTKKSRQRRKPST